MLDPAAGKIGKTVAILGQGYRFGEVQRRRGQLFGQDEHLFDGNSPGWSEHRFCDCDHAQRNAEEHQTFSSGHTGLGTAKELSARAILEYTAVLFNPLISSRPPTKDFNADFLTTYLVHQETAVYVGCNSELSDIDRAHPCG
jgi:hypothetical protein